MLKGLVKYPWFSSAGCAHRRHTKAPATGLDAGAFARGPGPARGRARWPIGLPQAAFLAAATCLARGFSEACFRPSSIQPAYSPLVVSKTSAFFFA